jgi:hypothetical protein
MCPTLPRLCACWPLWLAVVLLTPTCLHAQDSTKVRYTLRLSGIYSAGNADRLIVDTNGSFFYADSVWDFQLNPGYTYGEMATRTPTGETVRTRQENELVVRLNVGVFSHRRCYGFAPASYEQSNLRRIHARYQLGLGGGWHVLRRPTAKVTFTTAVLHEQTDFVDDALDYAVYRLSLRLRQRYRVSTNRLSISHTANYLPALSEAHNYLANSQLLLEYKFSGHLSFLLKHDLTYESVVSPGRRPMHQIATVGFSYTSQ